MADFKFVLPLYGVAKPAKKAKSASLSVNWYRNAYYRDLNNAKIKFKSMINDQLDAHDPFIGQIKIKYIYYAARDNSPDLDNFVSAVKKFFQDAIVEHGLIGDDNVHFIPANSEEYGGIDRDNPRVEAFVREIVK